MCNAQCVKLIRNTRTLVERKLRYSVALWSVTICRIKCPYPNVKESDKLILDPRPYMAYKNQHQSLTTSRRSPLALAYLPCLVEVRKRVRE